MEVPDSATATERQQFDTLIRARILYDHWLSPHYGTSREPRFKEVEIRASGMIPRHSKLQSIIHKCPEGSDDVPGLLEACEKAGYPDVAQPCRQFRQFKRQIPTTPSRKRGNTYNSQASSYDPQQPSEKKKKQTPSPAKSLGAPKHQPKGPLAAGTSLVTSQSSPEEGEIFDSPTPSTFRPNDGSPRQAPSRAPVADMRNPSRLRDNLTWQHADQEEDANTGQSLHPHVSFLVSKCAHSSEHGRKPATASLTAAANH